MNQTHKEELQQLITSLNLVVENPKQEFWDVEMGLCGNLEDMFYRVNYTFTAFDYEWLDVQLTRSFRSYSLFTGRTAYPVPHPRLLSETAYNTTYDLWDYTTTYGQNRKELLINFIKHLEGLIG